MNWGEVRMEPYLYSRCLSEITDEQGRWLFGQLCSKYSGLQDLMGEVSTEVRELNELRVEVHDLREKLEKAEFLNEIHAQDWDDEHQMTKGEWEKELQIQELRAEVTQAKHVKASTRQRSRIIWIATAIAVVMGVFPPWLVTYAGGIARPLGYGPIFSPPQPQIGGIHLDFVRLIVQWATVLFVAAGPVSTIGEAESAALGVRRAIMRIPELLRRFVAWTGALIFWAPIWVMAVVVGIAQSHDQESARGAVIQNVKTTLTNDSVAGPGMPADFTLSEFKVEQLSHDWTFFLGGDVRYRISSTAEVPKLTSKDFADYFYTAVQNPEPQYDLDRGYFDHLRTVYPRGLKDPELVQAYLREFPSRLAAFRLKGGGSLIVSYVLKHSQAPGHVLSVPASKDWQIENAQLSDKPRWTPKTGQ